MSVGLTLSGMGIDSAEASFAHNLHSSSEHSVDALLQFATIIYLYLQVSSECAN